VCIAVVLRPRGFRSSGGQLRLEAAGHPTQQLWFKEVCLWRLEPEAWWENEPGLMALGLFGRLNYPQLDVQRMIGVEKMRESKFYQEIMQEGELAGRRDDILQVLRTRFQSEPPAAIVAALDTLKKPKLLKRLLELALTSDSLQDFQTALRAQVGSP